MNPAQLAAFNSGVACVLNLARRSALVIEQRAARPLHDAFAIEALRALADEAETLLIAPSSGTAPALGKPPHA